MSSVLRRDDEHHRPLLGDARRIQIPVRRLHVLQPRGVDEGDGAVPLRMGEPGRQAEEGGHHDDPERSGQLLRQPSQEERAERPQDGHGQGERQEPMGGDMEVEDHVRQVPGQRHRAPGEQERQREPAADAVGAPLGRDRPAPGGQAGDAGGAQGQREGEPVLRDVLPELLRELGRGGGRGTGAAGDDAVDRSRGEGPSPHGDLSQTGRGRVEQPLLPPPPGPPRRDQVGERRHGKDGGHEGVERPVHDAPRAEEQDGGDQCPPVEQREGQRRGSGQEDGGGVHVVLVVLGGRQPDQEDRGPHRGRHQRQLPGRASERGRDERPRGERDGGRRHAGEHRGQQEGVHPQDRVQSGRDDGEGRACWIGPNPRRQPLLDVGEAFRLREGRPPQVARRVPADRRGEAVRAVDGQEEPHHRQSHDPDQQPGQDPGPDRGPGRGLGGSRGGCPQLADGGRHAKRIPGAPLSSRAVTPTLSRLLTCACG